MVTFLCSFLVVALQQSTNFAVMSVDEEIKGFTSPECSGFFCRQGGHRLSATSATNISGGCLIGTDEKQGDRSR